MKVLLASDYFYPFTPGGSEWSVYELAKSLLTKGIQAIVVSIDYGAKQQKDYHGLKVIRIPFVKKIKDTRSVVNPVWQNNPLFFIWSAYYLYKIVKASKPDIIHVNGKFLIPGSIIAGFLAKKPVIVTIRDKQILCPVGKCFFDSKRFRACTIWEYLTSDFPWFVNNYTAKNPLSFLYVLCGVTWARFSGNIIKNFAMHASAITTISNSQKKYLEANGFKNIRVIYNSANFKIPKTSISKTKSVLFVGKLSKGKGVELLLDAAEIILQNQEINLVFAGEIHTIKIKNRLKQKNFRPHIILLGSVDYHDLPAIYRKVSCLVMPSTYPESFGRAALEALSYGTPVVVTNTGALAEIVQDNVTGRVCDVSADDLASGILDVIKNEQKYLSNIKKHYSNLRQKFMITPNKQYIDLYRSLTG